MIKCTVAEKTREFNIANLPEKHVWKGIYFHDELEDLFQYDIVSYLSGDYSDFDTGIHEVEVVLPDNTVELCDMYVWRVNEYCDDKHDHLIGYIIRKDSLSKKFVMKQFENKVSHI